MSENILKWRFAPSGYGKRKGMSTGDAETFKRNPFGNFGREVIQNSIDARLSDEEPVVVEFSLFRISPAQIPNLEGLKTAVQRCMDFWKSSQPTYYTEYAFDRAKDGDVIYVDPPYDYQDDDGFTKYQMTGFSFSDFEKLKGCCDKAIDRGATVVISNNATEKVIELFSQDPKYRIYYNVTRLSTLRMINCKVESRRTGEEVIIWGALNSLPQANDIEKVITLACKCTNDYLNDKTQIRIDLDLGTDRQVAYYIYALQFLGYITQQHSISPRIFALNNDRKRIEADIFEQLKENKLFGSLYEENTGKKQKINKQKIEKIIREKYPKLSSSTVERRASTIKAWIEWMLNYVNTKSN